MVTGAADPPGPQEVPLLHQDAERPRGGAGVPGAAEGTHGRSRQGDLPVAFRAQLKAIHRWASSPSDLASIHQPVFVANGDEDRWCRPRTPSTSTGDSPTARLVLYPDAGHGGVFQFHEDFVDGPSSSSGRGPDDDTDHRRRSGPAVHGRDHDLEDRADPHDQRRRHAVRLPRARPAHRRAARLPAPLHRRPGRLGPAGHRRHRRQATRDRVRQPRHRRVGRIGAAHHRRDGRRRRRLHPRPRLRPGRPARLLTRRGRRAGDHPRAPRARPQGDSCRHGPRRRWRHREDQQDRGHRVHQGRAHPARSAALPVLQPERRTASAPRPTTWPV